MAEFASPIPSTTVNVFLDTEAFVEAGYNYETKRLVAVRVLAAQERIRVFLTDVTVREMRADLREAVEKAANMKPPSILRNSQLPEVQSRWAPFNLAKVEGELLGQLDSFIAATRITVIAVENDSLPAVLDKYFDRRPPFGTGKNKAEFPDALAVEALLTWCSTNDAVMSIVSRDGGVQACCSDSGPLRGYVGLPAFLDAVASEDEVLSAFIRQSLDTVYEDIDCAALEAFDKVEFHLSDEEGEVERVENVEVEWRGDVDIIYLTQALATIEFPAVFTFKVRANYYDSSSGWYDREDDVYMFRDAVDTSFPSSLERHVAVDIKLEDGSLRVRSAAIEGSLYVALRVNDDDPWD